MYCKNCGTQVDESDTFCSKCGASTQAGGANPPMADNSKKTACPRCGSTNVNSQIFQENLGSSSVTNTRSKYKEKGHGCLWWLLIGWWWWIVDLCLWIFLFFPRLLIQLFKKKKYTGSSKSVSTTRNQISYRSVFLCNDCGNSWQV